MRSSVWDAPLLVMPTVMRSTWDGADSATVSNLLQMALKEEEEEETEWERVKRQQAVVLDGASEHGARPGAHEEEDEEEEEAATSKIYLLRRLHSEIWTFFNEPLACPFLFGVCVLPCEYKNIGPCLVVTSGLSRILRATWFNSAFCLVVDMIQRDCSTVDTSASQSMEFFLNFTLVLREGRPRILMSILVFALLGGDFWHMSSYSVRCMVRHWIQIYAKARGEVHTSSS